MKIHNYFKDLSKFERTLWIISIITVSFSFLFSNGSWLNFIASLIGVTALIFVAKGYVIGQILSVIFAIFYGYISFHFRYYGELITYMCMTAPIALAAVVSWAKNPYKDTQEVTVDRLSKKQIATVSVLSIIVTVLFYFVLKYFDTANLIFSTISVTTSFLAVSFTYLRSPFYALAYSANDIVLIVLWTLATAEDIKYMPMIFCFIMFLVNDLYGYYNWKRIEKRQKDEV